MVQPVTQISCWKTILITSEFSDNFRSSSSICPILCLYPDYLPFRNNFGLISSSINCIKLQKNSKHAVAQKSLCFINYIQQIYLPLTSKPLNFIKYCNSLNELSVAMIFFRTLLYKILLMSSRKSI